MCIRDRAISETLGDAGVHQALEANSQLLPKPQTLAAADKAYADGCLLYTSRCV